MTDPTPVRGLRLRDVALAVLAGVALAAVLPAAVVLGVLAGVARAGGRVKVQ